MSNSLPQSKCIASKQPPSKLYDLFSVLVFILSLVFSDLVLAFRACWPFYSLLAPFHCQTATWSFSFLLTKLLQQFPWPSRCSLLHHTQWANRLRGSVSVSHLRQCPLLYFTPAACHLVLSTPSHLLALNPNRPLLSALTLPLFFFFFHKNFLLLFPLVFQIQPFPTITYSSHSTNHSLSSDLSGSFWFIPTVYSPFYLLCPQCLLHCLPLSR